MTVQDRKARERQRREDDILQAALALSARDDWLGVTIDEIARKAEIGKGTIYKHFTSKDDIYARLAVSFHRRVAARLRGLDAGLAPLERLRAIIRVFWETYATHAEYQRVVDYSQRPDFRRVVGDETRRAMDAVEADIGEIVQAALEQAIAAGVLPARPLPLLLFGAQAALHGALRLLWIDCLRGPKEGYLDELTSFILAGLARPAGAADRLRR